MKYYVTLQGILFDYIKYRKKLTLLGKEKK